MTENGVFTSTLRTEKNFLALAETQLPEEKLVLSSLIFALDCIVFLIEQKAYYPP